MSEDKMAICKSPWCKATFYHTDEVAPISCPKCVSFDQDLSGGVTWTEKTYEGPRFDGLPHITKIDVKKYLR